MMISEFGKALLFLIGGCIFVAGGMIIAWLISPNRPTPEKLTSYECGEDPIGTSWVQFNIRFYVMGLIFLIFDVEILLLFPWAFIFVDKQTLSTISSWGIFTFTE
ncbi:MAG: NADH-quinone oxidoreductase subunit A, partial [Bacteroidia bacterium]|nr:NADH-quinone oxidoreductase subunit A [Bacteroidia bacterium]